MTITNEQNNRFLFISIMRVIAICLITNTHYNNVYPSESFAVGGLIGDVIFFVVSGYCYGFVGEKQRLIPWYIKRIIRIYPAVLIMLVLHSVLNYWDVSKVGFFRYYVFPTNFTFVGAIMVVYFVIYFYSLLNSKKLLLLFFACLTAIWILLYLFVFDKNTYFMNDTSHPSCFFLYALASMIGVFLRKSGSVSTDKKTTDKKKWLYLLFVIILILVCYYMANKYIRSRQTLLSLQIIIPILLLLFALLFTKLFVQLEDFLKKIPGSISAIIIYLASISLEIYVVQRLIIRAFESIIFPLNWIVITSLILIASIVLHFLCNSITRLGKRIKSEKVTE